jgi:hypothetical protein
MSGHGGAREESMTEHRPTNEQIADTLRKLAGLLELQRNNEHRIRSYRTAASVVEDADFPVAESVQTEGLERIRTLPGIGKGIAGSIREIVGTGRLGLLERLKAEHEPQQTFTAVPGIGGKLAERIHRELGISSLEELERAAHDGRLERVPGFGKQRVEGLKETLNSMLSRSARRRERRIAAETGGPGEPPIDILLETDREYREKAESGTLRTIAPKRFNPEGTAWLPIMHTRKKGWRLTAMFSNTARAHELGTTHEWVVIYYRRDGYEEQCTVVPYGKKADGRVRVVRGRERESLDYRKTPA